MWLLKRPKLSLALALLGLSLLFAAQNAAPAQVNFLFWTFAMPVWGLILAMGSVGVLVGWVLGEWRHKRAGQRSATGGGDDAGAAPGARA